MHIRRYHPVENLSFLCIAATALDEGEQDQRIYTDEICLTHGVRIACKLLAFSKSYLGGCTSFCRVYLALCDTATHKSSMEREIILVRSLANERVSAREAAEALRR